MLQASPSSTSLSSICSPTISRPTRTSSTLRCSHRSPPCAPRLPPCAPRLPPSVLQVRGDAHWALDTARSQLARADLRRDGPEGGHTYMVHICIVHIVLEADQPVVRTRRTASGGKDDSTSSARLASLKAHGAPPHPKAHRPLSAFRKRQASPSQTTLNDEGSPVFISAAPRHAPCLAPRHALWIAPHYAPCIAQG